MAKNIESLTGIRGIAALMVVLYHIPLAEMFSLSAAPIAIRNASYGVDLFFILSGFILAHMHLRDFELLDASKVRSFYLLRFLRVYPLHLALLLAIASFVLLNPDFKEWARSLPNGNGTFSLAAFVQTLTLTNGVGLPNMGGYNHVSWTLSAEAAGYALFPFLAYLLIRVRSAPLCTLLVALLLTAFSAAMILRGHLGVTRVLLCFPAGMALGRIYQVAPIAPQWAPILTAGSAVAAIVMLSVDPLAPLSVFAFAGLILGLAWDRESSTARLLQMRSVLWLGQISFSLYLSHYVLSLVVIWGIWDGEITRSDPYVAVAVLLCAIFAVATLTYKVVEAPSHRLARAVAKQRHAGKLEAELNRLTG